MKNQIWRLCHQRARSEKYFIWRHTLMGSHSSVRFQISERNSFHLSVRFWWLVDGSNGVYVSLTFDAAQFSIYQKVRRNLFLALSEHRFAPTLGSRPSSRKQAVTFQLMSDGQSHSINQLVGSWLGQNLFGSNLRLRLFCVNSTQIFLFFL